MHIVRHLESLPTAARGGAVAIGNFDGVHHGHLAIVRRLLERAAAVGGPAIVFTFDPHPVRLLRPEQCPPPLTWTERKAELLAGLDDRTAINTYPFNEALHLGINGHVLISLEFARQSKLKIQVLRYHRSNNHCWRLGRPIRSRLIIFALCLLSAASCQTPGEYRDCNNCYAPTKYQFSASHLHFFSKLLC